MPSLDSLLRNTATADVEYAGETIHVEYKPSLMTESFLAEDISVVESLMKLVTDWDLTQGTGKGKRKYPITKTGLSKLPLPLLRAILLGILTDGTNTGQEGNS